MTNVTVLEPGRRVKVGPDDRGLTDARTLLEYAEALIETHGWNKSWKYPTAGFAISQPTSIINPPPQAGIESGTANGYTLHDAIGEAGERLVGHNDPTADGKNALTRSRPTDARPARRSLRTEAHDLLAKTGLVTVTASVGGVAQTRTHKHRDDTIDKEWENQPERTQDDVLAVLRAAQEVNADADDDA